MIEQIVKTYIFSILFIVLLVLLRELRESIENRRIELHVYVKSQEK